mgnify:CR=1 FL=1
MSREIWFEMMVIFILSIQCILIAGVLFYALENGHNSHVTNIFDGIWWSVVTLTTIGYGDVYPELIRDALEAAGGVRVSLWNRSRGGLCFLQNRDLWFSAGARFGVVWQRRSRECDRARIYRNGDESDGDEFGSGSQTQGDGSHADGVFWETRRHRLGSGLFSFGCIKLCNRRLNPG